MNNLKESDFEIYDAIEKEFKQTNMQKDIRIIDIMGDVNL